MPTPKVFIIEKEQTLRLLFEGLLKEHSYTLENLEDVDFRLPDFGPNLVILGAGLFLEDPKGTEAKMAICAHIPCALMGFEEEIAQARGLGWSGLELLKPLKVKELQANLRELAAQLKN